MEALYVIFMHLVNMSITASYIIAAVIVTRLFLKRLPKVYSYCLWAIVGFRLICPFTFSSDLSIFNLSIFNFVQKEPNQGINDVLNTINSSSGSTLDTNHLSML